METKKTDEGKRCSECNAILKKGEKCISHSVHHKIGEVPGCGLDSDSKITGSFPVSKISTYRFYFHKKCLGKLIDIHKLENPDEIKN